MSSSPRTARFRCRAWISPGLPSLALAGLLALLLAPGGCQTREKSPIVAADSTLVYSSKLGEDVTASIAFALKDSRIVEEAKRLEKERKREARALIKDLTRRQRAAERDLAELKKASAAASKSATKKGDSKKSRKSGKKSKKSDSKKSASKKAPAAQVDSKDESTVAAAASNPGSDSVAKKKTGKARSSGKSKSATSKSTRKSDGGRKLPRISLAAAEKRVQELSDSLATFQTADSLASAEAEERIRLLQAEEHAFDLEEGARIQARINLENAFARGQRPLLMHLVWIQPTQKAAFRKMIEWVPNDSSNVLTSNFTISPSKRIPGLYRLRVYMFRELIAEKLFELRGTAEGPGESEKEDAMM